MKRVKARPCRAFSFGPALLRRKGARGIIASPVLLLTDTGDCQYGLPWVACAAVSILLIENDIRQSPAEPNFFFWCGVAPRMAARGIIASPYFY
jgi:hypothetical protein